MKKGAIILTALTVLLANHGRFVSGLTCYSCSSVSSISRCTAVVTCGATQRCFTEESGAVGHRRITMGCKTEQACLGLSTSVFVGKRSTANITDCHQCCAVNGCNKQLCVTFDKLTAVYNGTCLDDPAYNCAGLSGSVNLCSDVHHAKQMCRKWCGLCNLVDGSWGSWSQWSSCSRTCNYGINTRHRSCNNPAPAHGGLDCIGSNNATRSCYSGHPCPINGGWSSWYGWSSCSVTCGGGTRSRQRHCNNPTPDYNGHYCSGEEYGFSVCAPNACDRDGHWTSWSEWLGCSSSCGYGMRYKTRSCTNPAPLRNGQWCHGDAHTYELCISNHTCGDLRDNIRLVGGSKTSGRVEVYIMGRWGTVCDDQWSVNNAKVVCKMLGKRYGNATAKSNAFFGEGSGPTWMDDVKCVGNETSLFQCQFPGFGIEDCSHPEDAGVICA